MFKVVFAIGASVLALTASNAEAVTFAYTGETQNYTLPALGFYKVTAAGAAGGTPVRGQVASAG